MHGGQRGREEGTERVCTWSYGEYEAFARVSSLKGCLVKRSLPSSSPAIISPFWSIAPLLSFSVTGKVRSLTHSPLLHSVTLSSSHISLSSILRPAVALSPLSSLSLALRRPSLDTPRITHWNLLGVSSIGVSKLSTDIPHQANRIIILPWPCLSHTWAA